MDSMTRAIMIAGGMLIGVLIVSISIYELSSFRDYYELNNKALIAREITNFNSYFDNIGIDNKYGYEVYNVIGKVVDINSNPNLEHSISINYSSPSLSFISSDANTLRKNRDLIFYYTEKFAIWSGDGNNRYYLKNFNIQYERDSLGYIDTIVIREL